MCSIRSFVFCSVPWLLCPCCLYLRHTRYIIFVYLFLGWVLLPCSAAGAIFCFLSVCLTKIEDVYSLCPGPATPMASRPRSRKPSGGVSQKSWPSHSRIAYGMEKKRRTGLSSYHHLHIHPAALPRGCPLCVFF